MGSKNKFIVYALKDPRTKEIRYIGKSCVGLERPKSHCSPSRLKGDGMTYKSNWIKSLLKLNLKPLIEVIEECDDHESLKIRELFWIEFYSKTCKLVNSTTAKEGSAFLTDSTKQKLKNAKKKFKESPEYKNYIENISRNSKKLWKNKELRNKLIEIKKDLWKDPNYRKMMSDNSFKRLAKFKIQDQNGVVYNSCKEAAKILGLHASGICHVLKGKLKQTGGYTFKKLEEWY